jgi:hypothetical protein
MRRRMSQVPIDKRIQKQIDHLNKNLKKEIDDRLSADDRYRLACYYLDQRIEKLEKKKLFTKMEEVMKVEKKKPNKLALHIPTIIISFLLLLLVVGIIISVTTQ